jgi:hypothetical protein
VVKKAVMLCVFQRFRKARERPYRIILAAQIRKPIIVDLVVFQPSYGGKVAVYDGEIAPPALTLGNVDVRISAEIRG